MSNNCDCYKHVVYIMYILLGGVIVSVLASSVIYRGVEPMPVQTRYMLLLLPRIIQE